MLHNTALTFILITFTYKHTHTHIRILHIQEINFLQVFTMVSAWEEFYAKQPPPQDLTENENKLKEFTQKHLKDGNKIALVTVGVSLIS